MPMWYYKVMGEIVGPLKSSEFRKHASEGKITPNSDVRRGPDGKWVSAYKVKGLFDTTGKLPAKHSSPDTNTFPRPPEPSPLPNESPPDSSPPSYLVRVVLSGLLLLTLIMYLFSLNWKTSPQERDELSKTGPEAQLGRTEIPKQLSPEESFREIFKNVNSGRHKISEKLPNTTGFNLDASFTEVEISNDFRASGEYDIKKTNSIISPYQGVIEFGVVIKAKITDTVKGLAAPPPGGISFNGARYQLDTKSNERVSAIYEFKEGNWILDKIILTTANFQVFASQNDAISMAVASDMRKSKGWIGKRTTFSPDDDFQIVRLLQLNPD